MPKKKTAKQPEPTLDEKLERAIDDAIHQVYMSLPVELRHELDFEEAKADVFSAKLLGAKMRLEELNEPDDEE